MIGSDALIQIDFLRLNAAKHIEKGQYAWATVYLKDTLKCINQLLESTEYQQATEEKKHLIHQIKIPCHKNLSLCYLKGRNYLECIQECQWILKYEEKNLTAIYRTGVALLHARRFLEAKQYLETALSLSPQQKDIRKALQIVKTELENFQKQKMKSVKKKIKYHWSIASIIVFLLLFPYYLWKFSSGKMKDRKQDDK